MNARSKVLRQLIRESHYVVDEAAVAEAIVMRAQARQALPDFAFRADARGGQVRSFRRHRQARSFRLITAGGQAFHKKPGQRPGS